MKKVIVALLIIAIVVALAFMYLSFELRQLDWGLAAEIKTTTERKTENTTEFNEKNILNNKNVSYTNTKT